MICTPCPSRHPRAPSFRKETIGLPWRGDVGVKVDSIEDTEPTLMVNRWMETKRKNGNNKHGRGAITWGRIFFGSIISHIYIYTVYVYIYINIIYIYARCEKKH